MPSLWGWIGILGTAMFAFASYRGVFHWESWQRSAAVNGTTAPRWAMVSLALGMTALSAGIALHSFATKTDPAKIDGIEAAQAYVIGTWTYTDPIRENAQHLLYWQKWTFRSDGTVVIAEAKPTDSEWGPSEQHHYAVFTSKYSDTGKRYYGVHVENSAIGALIADDGSLLYTNLTNVAGRMQRGDQSPFSR